MSPTLLPSPAPHPTACSGAGVVAVPFDLHAAVRSRLAAAPDLRAGVVASTRARLLADGPPSAEELADMLVDELGPRCRASRTACRGQGTGRRYA